MPVRDTYLFHRLHHVLGAGVLLVRKREGSISGGRHSDVGRMVMVKEEGEGNEENDDSFPRPFIRWDDKREQTKEQTKANKVT